MKRKLRLLLITLVILCLVPSALMAAGQEEEAPVVEKAEPFSIACFVPGVVAGSPLYELMVEGTERAVAEYDNASLKVLEAGFNQAEWTEKMTSLAATGEYNLIITSNPAMPFICAEVAKDFPNQKFLNVDAYLDGIVKVRQCCNYLL